MISGVSLDEILQSMDIRDVAEDRPSVAVKWTLAGSLGVTEKSSSACRHANNIREPLRVGFVVLSEFKAPRHRSCTRYSSIYWTLESTDDDIASRWILITILRTRIPQHWMSACRPRGRNPKAQPLSVTL
jgi:hypothetical protein